MIWEAWIPSGVERQKGTGLDSTAQLSVQLAEDLRLGPLSSRKGVGRGQVVRSVQEDDEGPNAREDDEGPQEKAIHYHGHKLPVFFQRVAVLLLLQLPSDVADGGNGLP